MKTRLTVCEEKEVEIPDLPASVVALCAEYGAGIEISIADDTSYDGSTHTFWELWVEIIDPKDEEKQEAFDAALARSDDYDEVFTGTRPWYQTDMDEEKPLRDWEKHQRGLYPDFRFS